MIRLLASPFLRIGYSNRSFQILLRKLPNETRLRRIPVALLQRFAERPRMDGSLGKRLGILPTLRQCQDFADLFCASHLATSLTARIPKESRIASSQARLAMTGSGRSRAPQHKRRGWFTPTGSIRRIHRRQAQEIFAEKSLRERQNC